MASRSAEVRDDAPGLWARRVAETATGRGHPVRAVEMAPQAASSMVTPRRVRSADDADGAVTGQGRADTREPATVGTGSAQRPISVAPAGTTTRVAAIRGRGSERLRVGAGRRTAAVEPGPTLAVKGGDPLDESKILPDPAGVAEEARGTGGVRPGGIAAANIPPADMRPLGSRRSANRRTSERAGRRARQALYR